MLRNVLVLVEHPSEAGNPGRFPENLAPAASENLDNSKVEHSDKSTCPRRTTPQQDHTQAHGSRAAGSARSAGVSAAASAAHHSAVACCQAQRAECSARELSARAAADSAVPQRVEGTQGCAGRRYSSQRVCPWGSRRAMAAACCHELYARRARRARAAPNSEQPLHLCCAGTQDQGGHRREVSSTSRLRWRRTSSSSRSLSGRPSARAPATPRATPSARPAVASVMTSRRCGEAMLRRREARRA